MAIAERSEDFFHPEDGVIIDFPTPAEREQRRLEQAKKELAILQAARAQRKAAVIAQFSPIINSDRHLDSFLAQADEAGAIRMLELKEKMPGHLVTKTMIGEVIFTNITTPRKKIYRYSLPNNTLK